MREFEGHGWLCEPEDAPNESWLSDVPWVKANDRIGHYGLIRHRDGVSNVYDPMRFVCSPADLFDQVFYGRSENQILGFTERYSSMDPNRAQNAVCVFDGGGRSGALTSVWLLVWGPRTLFIVTPDGKPPVMSGEAGLVTHDWRFAIRIANVAPDYDCAVLASLLERALVSLPVCARRDPEKHRPVIYMNRETHERFQQMSYRGIFIRRVPMLRWDEQAIAVPSLEAA